MRGGEGREGGDMLVGGKEEMNKVQDKGEKEDKNRRIRRGGR